MLIVFNETTVISVDKILSMMIKYEPKKEKTIISSGFLGLFPSYNEVEIPFWKLEFNYTKPGGGIGNEWTFTQTSGDRNSLKQTGLEIIQQIKSFDASMVNVAFENAFLKD